MRKLNKLLLFFGFVFILWIIFSNKVQITNEPKVNVVNDSLYIDNSTFITYKNDSITVFNKNKKCSILYKFFEDKIFINAIYKKNKLHKYALIDEVLIVPIKSINNISELLFIDINKMEFLEQNKLGITSASWIYVNPNLKSFATLNSIYPDSLTTVHFHKIVKNNYVRTKSNDIYLTLNVKKNPNLYKPWGKQ